MSLQTCTWLQAQSDFSTFWFPIGILRSVLIELHFHYYRPNVFDLTIERRHVLNAAQPDFFSERDVDDLLRAVVQAIELYTGKYPDRSVRCRTGGHIQTIVFRILLRANQAILTSLFSIQQEEKNGFQPFRWKSDPSTFLLKRKPEPQRKTHPIHLTLNTYSQLFGNPVYVRLCEEVA